MSKRLYLSGAMSGIPEHNFPAFQRATSYLRSHGYSVISPAELNPDLTDKPLTWEEYLIRDLNLLTMHCDGIALLPGWESSRGARLELAVALQLGMFVIDAVTREPIDINNRLVFSDKSGRDLCLNIKDNTVQETHTLCQDSPLMQT